MNIQQLERQLASVRTEAKVTLARFNAAANAAGRVMTETEQTAVQRLLDEGAAIKVRIDRARGDASMSAAIEAMTGGMSTVPASSRGTGTSLGAQFVASDVYRWLQDTKDTRAGTWTSPATELRASTLTEDAASGGALVIPDHQPGILPLPTRPLTMADLIAPGTTESNLVTYMREKTWTNAADTVEEGAAKPESALIFEAVSDPVRKIATWIPVTEEMLEDVPALSSYLDTRLRLGVQLKEDDELLNGSIVAPDIVGFLARTGLATPVARGADVNADAILKQIAAIFTTTGLQPTGLVMNPSNWLTIQLLKTAAGEYISGNGPFSTPQAPTLWGLPVALTSAMAAGTALVGAFQTAAQVFRKGGLRVEASNSHANFFVENKVAIRAEERLALAVYRPSAFGTVTGLN